MLVKANGKNREYIEALTKLHSDLLPESAVSKLGSFFMRKFYYSTLVKKGLIDAYLYDCDGKYAGFISCTAYPFNFMKKGVLSSPFKLVYVLKCSVAFTDSVKYLKHSFGSNAARNTFAA